MRNFVLDDSLTAFTRSIVSPALQAVAQHWCDLCVSGRLPNWSDIRPSSIKPQLPIVWAYEYLANEDDFVGRLAGSQITGVSNKPFKDTRLSELRPTDKYPRSLIRARRVLHEPALYRGHGLVYKTVESCGIGERIVMPLGTIGTAAHGLFGATEYRPFSELQCLDQIEHEKWFTLAGLS